MADLFFAEDGIEELKEAFGLFDTDGNGKVDAEHLGNLLRSMGLSPSQEDIDDCMKHVNKKGDGFIDFNEFKDMVTNRATNQESEDLLMKAFKVFSSGQKGKCSVKELRHAMMAFNNDCTLENVDAFFKDAPVNGDVLDYESYALKMTEV